MSSIMTPTSKTKASSSRKSSVAGDVSDLAVTAVSSAISSSSSSRHQLSHPSHHPQHHASPSSSFNQHTSNMNSLKKDINKTYKASASTETLVGAGSSSLAASTKLSSSRKKISSSMDAPTTTATLKKNAATIYTQSSSSSSHPVQKKKLKSSSKSIAPKSSVTSTTTTTKPPSMDFLSLLNKKATLIQRWWRKWNPSPSPVSVSYTPSDQPDQGMSDHDMVRKREEDEAVARRKMRADQVRDEIMRELELEEKVNSRQEQDTSNAFTGKVAIEVTSNKVEEVGKKMNSIEEIPLQCEELKIPDYEGDQLEEFHSQEEELREEEIRQGAVNAGEDDFKVVEGGDVTELPIILKEENPHEEEEEGSSSNHPLENEVTPLYCDSSNSSDYCISEPSLPQTPGWDIEEEEENEEHQSETLSLQNTHYNAGLTVEEAVAPIKHTVTFREDHSGGSTTPRGNIPVNQKPTQIQEKAQQPTDGDATSQSVNRILSFLKNVENSPSQIQTPLISSNNNSNPSPSIFDDVKQKIMATQIEVTQKTRTITTLQTELIRLRESHKRDMEELQKKGRSQLSLQRKEYETIVKRHLAFIESVLSEKESLSAKTVELTEKVQLLERQFQQKSLSMEESHTRYIAQQKEVWAAGEKLKREKWVQERTRVIKEQTVQGLEPEIQKLIAQQKSALRQAEESFRETLTREKNAMAENLESQLNQLREKHVGERQRACEEEREFARQRYMKQLEREEMEFQQQKRKLLAEFEQERQTSQATFAENCKDFETSHKRQVETMRKEAQRLAEERVLQAEDQRKKYEMDLALLRERLTLEKEEWQGAYMKKVDTQVRQREKALRDHLIQQRDAEIEVVIQRLESESGSSTSDATRRYRMDIERIKGETAEEIKNLRDQHSLALDKLLTSNKTLQSLEMEHRTLQKENLTYQHSIQAKDSLLKRQKEEIARLSSDENILISQIRGNFEETITTLTSEVTNLTSLLTSEKLSNTQTQAHLQSQLQSLTKEKEETIRQVEVQVRQTLASKDMAISSLQGQVEEERRKVEGLERLMDQQRNELLGL